jgi:hypothetical protein
MPKSNYSEEIFKVAIENAVDERAHFKEKGFGIPFVDKMHSSA